MEVLVVLLIVWSVFIFIACYVAKEKGRDTGEAIIFTLLLGPIGILIVAMLPTIAKDPTQVAQADKDKAQFIADYQARMEAAEQARLDRDHAETDRLRAEAKQRKADRDAMYRSKGINPGPFAWLECACFDSIHWFKNASDGMQLLVSCLLISLVVGCVAVAVFKR